jgi:hypothetical protein
VVMGAPAGAMSRMPFLLGSGCRCIRETGAAMEWRGKPRNHRSLWMRLFQFSPGDGTSYRFLFGHLPADTPYIEAYTLFGYAEGDDALIVYPFDTSRVTLDTFARKLGTARHTQLAGDADVVLYTAWRVYAALTGTDEEDAAAYLPVWSHDWRLELFEAAGM